MIDATHNSSITYNLFQQGGRGVYIDPDSTFNSIHHNTFQYCSAEDDSVSGNNYWYDLASQEGNYWWDYSGSGIYSIWGAANANDSYPLGSPPIPIIPEYHPNPNLNYSILILLIPLIVALPYIRKRKK
jgi:hypothetical protein